MQNQTVQIVPDNRQKYLRIALFRLQRWLVVLLDLQLKSGVSADLLVELELVLTVLETIVFLWYEKFVLPIIIIMFF